MGAFQSKFSKLAKKLLFQSLALAHEQKVKKISKINENSNFVKIVNLAQKMLRLKYDGAEVMKIKKARCNVFDLDNTFE